MTDKDERSRKEIEQFKKVFNDDVLQPIAQFFFRHPWLIWVMAAVLFGGLIYSLFTRQIYD